ncbi:MAG: DUF2007 domain-containing protein [Betaproteobacteria bacterium]|nr:DUF2007 domain-containing protein [Betaproteobacteria bacterium]
MKRLCNATNLPEAHLLAGWLSQRGIRVRVFNANAAGALGELPVDAASPQIWLEDPRDEARARESLEAFRREASGPGRPCLACGEENPPAFELCWACGKSLPP